MRQAGWDFGTKLFDDGVSEFQLLVNDSLIETFNDVRKMNAKIDELLDNGTRHKDIHVVRVNTKRFSILDMRG